jgi:hypothetical protein
MIALVEIARKPSAGRRAAPETAWLLARWHWPART